MKRGSLARSPTVLVAPPRARAARSSTRHCATAYARSGGLLTGLVAVRPSCSTIHPLRARDSGQLHPELTRLADSTTLATVSTRWTFGHRAAGREVALRSIQRSPETDAARAARRGSPLKRFTGLLSNTPVRPCWALSLAWLCLIAAITWWHSPTPWSRHTFARSRICPGLLPPGAERFGH